MRMHWLAHVPFEGLGAVEPWARSRGHALTCTRLYLGEALPAPGDFDMLVVMGGPMGVGDVATYPWLADEMALIRAAAQAGRGVLGICLGAQLIAGAHGATVRRNAQPEIGWFEVERVPGAASDPFGAMLPERLLTFHWHADTFDLPGGAVWLARSAACAHQAFALGPRTLGVQFHPEMTPEGLEDLLAALPGPLPAGPFVQPAPAMRALAAQRAGQRLLEAWLAHFERLHAGA